MGDTVRLGPQEDLPYYRVILLEPEEALVLQSVNPSTGAPGETWGFYLAPNGSEGTRLIVRHRSQPSVDATERVVNGVFEPISFVMERKMLKGIRDRAAK